MQIILVGLGKLSDSIESLIEASFRNNMQRWGDFDKTENRKCIVIHTGSGRELDACIDYCSFTNSVLVEMATGGKLETKEINFPAIICPNTSLLLLKLMHVLKNNGQLFQGSRISITESHQNAKKSLPGTAVEFAASLNVSQEDIVSIRDPDEQLALGIHDKDLGLHAYHKIVISDDQESEIVIETNVSGHLSYVRGLEKIIRFIDNNVLENRVYKIEEIIEII